MDASTGAQDFVGGLGAILSQIDQKGQFSVIAYSSRLLGEEEKHFSPFLLKMRAMVWATHHFKDQLRGQNCWRQNRGVLNMESAFHTNPSRIQESKVSFSSLITSLCKPEPMLQHKRLLRNTNSWLSNSTLSSSTNKASTCRRTSSQDPIWRLMPFNLWPVIRPPSRA